MDREGLVMLAYGLTMARPIPDLASDEDGIRATLAFGTTEHKTFVPWTAVVALGGAHFAVMFQVELGKQAEAAKPPTPATPGPKLRRV